MLSGVWGQTEFQVNLKLGLTPRRTLGPWDTEWSLVHWMRVLRVATMAATINTDFDDNNDCRELMKRVKNYLFYVASAA